MIILISTLAFFFYLLATFRLGSRLLQTENTDNDLFKSHALVIASVALALHGYVLYQNIIISSGMNLGFYNALSLMSWGVSLIVLIAAFSRPLENLAIVFFPLAAFALYLGILFPSSRILPDDAPMGLRLHVILSIFAYSLLTIAALQAALLAFQDHQISNKTPSGIMRLPPMQIMEDLLIQIIAIGFFMLSLSLATGLMFLHDIFTQHLTHKAVLSILAWLIFGILLWGRWSRGWRGKKIVRWTIGGFVSLMLAYFGSKLVLELILKRI